MLFCFSYDTSDRSVLTSVKDIDLVNRFSGAECFHYRISSLDLLTVHLFFFHSISATQNMFKYTQTHREIEVLTNTSYCFIVYVLTIADNTLLTGSCTLHSR